MTRLILWRHGQTAWNLARRVQGQTDVELTDVGRAQATAAAPVLAALRPDVIVSSDLSRAADTATALAVLTSLDIAFDARLRERAYGDWEGVTDVEMERGWPDAYVRWRRDEPIGAADVEEHVDLDKRMGAALQEAAERAPGGTVVVVSHGGAIRRGTGALLGWPEAVTRALGGLANCHWTELRLTPVRGWMLLAHNVGVPGVPGPSDATGGRAGTTAGR